MELCIARHQAATAEERATVDKHTIMVEDTEAEEAVGVVAAVAVEAIIITIMATYTMVEKGLTFMMVRGMMICIARHLLTTVRKYKVNEAATINIINTSKMREEGEEIQMV